MDWTSFYIVILQSIIAEKIKHTRLWNWRGTSLQLTYSEIYITTYNDKEESDFQRTMTKVPWQLHSFGTTKHKKVQDYFQYISTYAAQQVSLSYVV